MIRALRAPILLVVIWLVLDQLFTVVAGHEGLLAPFGPVRVAPMLLGFLVIVLRVGVTFLVLPWTVWRLTRASAFGSLSSPRAHVHTGPP